MQVTGPQLTAEVGDSGEATALSRRQFIKQASAGAAVTLLFTLGIGGGAKGAAFPDMGIASGVVFPEPSLCIGCLTCEVVCSQVHKEVGLSSKPRIRIYDDPAVTLHPEILRNYPGRGTYLQQPCLMCPEAPCVAVCPVDAVKMEPRTQARYIDESICIACGRCAEACPFDVIEEARATNGDFLGQLTRITYDPDKRVYTKCDLCYWREGGPACVERCPVNIRIRQGIVKSEVFCLDLPRSTPETFEQLRRQQTV